MSLVLVEHKRAKKIWEQIFSASEAPTQVNSLQTQSLVLEVELKDVYGANT